MRLILAEVSRIFFLERTIGLSGTGCFFGKRRLDERYSRMFTLMPLPVVCLASLRVAVMAQVSEQSEPAMQLEASLPDWCVLSWRHAVVCVGFVSLFLYFSYLPIPQSSTWHDVCTGGVIANDGLYLTDPALPLADGIRHSVNGWLGKVVIHRLSQRGGLDLLSLSFAILQTLTAILWALLFVRVSGRWWASMLAIAAVVACAWMLDGVTTLTLGQLCFAIVACLLFSDATGSASTQSRTAILPSVFHWSALLSTMLLWTNVDGTFLIGWALIALLLVARATDVFLAAGEQKWISMLADAEVRQWLILLEACVLIALVNPLGWHLHANLLCWPDQPTWHALGGWQPLALASWQGIALAMMWTVWVVASRYTPSISTWQWLMPAAATILMASCRPALVWGAPLMVLTAISMLPPASPLPAFAERGTHHEGAPLRFAFTLICGLIVWVGFTISPHSHHVLGGKGRSEAQMLGVHFPTSGISALHSNDQRDGLLWSPNYWSDCLQTSGQVTSVFANRNMFSIPQRAQSDYQTIYFGRENWRKLLDQYDVDQILIDKSRQDRLLKNLRKQPGDWRIVHEDDLAVLLVRRGLVVADAVAKSEASRAVR